jgi:protein-S-isoprenylcysteine O-methyltransferase Ste14
VGGALVMTRIVVFVLLSAGIVVFSWRSLKNPRSHGFSRFFAFEFILVLFLLNFAHWFTDPFSALQIASWLLLLLSLALATDGFIFLVLSGKPSGRRAGSPNLGFENTTRLVILRSYRFIRHPLYCSLLLLAWGIFLKDITLWSTITVAAASVSLYLSAKVEERENVATFGDEYVQYMGRTKMFIPYLF